MEWNGIGWGIGAMIDRMLGPLVRLGLFVDFSLRVIGAAPRALLARAGEVLRQFERVAWGSFPIVAVAGLSVGMVTWLQTRRLLVTYGAQATLPSILTVAVLVETGPMLAGLVAAGGGGGGAAPRAGGGGAAQGGRARAGGGRPPPP